MLGDFATSPSIIAPPHSARPTRVPMKFVYASCRSRFRELQGLSIAGSFRLLLRKTHLPPGGRLWEHSLFRECPMGLCYRKSPSWVILSEAVAAKDLETFS